MAELDPQVQTRIIDLAWEITTMGIKTTDFPRVQDARIRELTKEFDQAYKAILKTIAQK